MSFLQTVKFAVDHLHNAKILATDLLKLLPEEFAALRRSVLQCASETPPITRLTCGVCGMAVHLDVHGSGNRYFRHRADMQDCPWFRGGAASRELQDAEAFLWEKESEEHHRLKWLIADALNRDPEVNHSAKVQETLWSGLLGDEWRRPDVRCTWRGQQIAFELQLGTTHLREVVARENFYRDEKILVIWVFHPAALETATRSDEHYFNRRNIFVAHEPEAGSGPSPGLRLLCRYDEPKVYEDGHVWAETKDAFVSLADLTFPHNHHRPFYFDYTAKRAVAEAESVRIIAELRMAAEHEAAELRAAAEREAAERLRRNPLAPLSQALPTQPATVTRLPAATDIELEAKAAVLFCRSLDPYRQRMDSISNRVTTFASILLLFPHVEIRAAASEALYYPRFQLLLMVRGLETAKPFPASDSDLVAWCNDRLAQLDGPGVELVEALVGYAAWSAYPPSQPREVQERLTARFEALLLTVRTSLQRDGADRRFLQLVCRLFPRVGLILKSKLNTV